MISLGACHKLHTDVSNTPGSLAPQSAPAAELCLALGPAKSRPSSLPLSKWVTTISSTVAPEKVCQVVVDSLQDGFQMTPAS